MNTSVNAQIVIVAGALESGNGTRDQHIRKILEVNRYSQIVFELSHIVGLDTEKII